MTTPYHFDAHTPPRLTESMLCRELERRRARRQALLLYAAAVASILAGALVGLWLLPLVPRLALVFLSGAGLALLSCGAGGVLLYYKRKELFLT